MDIDNTHSDTLSIELIIIQKLLAHIVDLKLLVKGYGNKTYERIDDELKDTELMCAMVYSYV